MLIEIFGLIKALIWPVVVVWLILKFAVELRAILVEVPPLLRRLLTLKAMGTEVTLATLEREVSRAEDETKTLTLPVPTKPELLEFPNDHS